MKSLVAHPEEIGAGYYTVNVTHSDPKDVGVKLTKEQADDLAKEVEALPQLIEALEEIAEGKGAYNEDRLIHAGNCIESMKQLAAEAIQKIKP